MTKIEQPTTALIDCYRLSRMLMFAACAIAAASCSRPRPVRLVAGTADTVVVNNRMSVPLPVYGLDARGRRLVMRDLRFQWLSGDSMRVSETGVITCDRRADARMRATSRDVSTDFSLFCRPIQGFAFPGAMWLVAGGAPQDVDFQAVGMDRRPEGLLAGSMTVRDSTIAYLKDGRVYPRAPGTTSIDIEAGDCTMAVQVQVDERAENSTSLKPNQSFVVSPLSLAAGEMRRWPIAPGPYEIWINGDGMQLVTSAINCVKSNDGRYWCVALPKAVVFVRNTQPAGRGKTLVGNLYVRRRYDADRDGPVPRPTQQAPRRNTNRAAPRHPPGWCAVPRSAQSAR